jgi:hypothetical protein
MQCQVTWSNCDGPSVITLLNVRIPWYVPENVPCFGSSLARAGAAIERSWPDLHILLTERFLRDTARAPRLGCRDRSKATMAVELSGEPAEEGLLLTRSRHRSGWVSRWACTKSRQRSVTSHKIILHGTRWPSSGQLNKCGVIISHCFFLWT